MAVPTKGIQRYDLSMSYSEFSLAMNKMKFVATQVFPLLNKSLTGDTSFLRINIKSLLKPVEDTKRAAKAGYKRDTFTWDDDSYKLEDHGAEEVVDDHNIDKWSDIIRQEQIHASRACDRVLRALERDVADTVFSDDWSHKTAAATPFTNYAAATPIDVIEEGIEAVGNRVGANPNTLIIGDTLWRNMIRCAQFEDKLSNGTNDNPNRISMAGFQTLFPSISRLIIPSCRTNTADNESQAVSLERLWDPTRMMIAHVNDDGMDGDIESPVPNIGRTLVDVGGLQPLPGVSEVDDPMLIFEEYREDARRGSVIRARNYRQVKVLHEAAGELITGLA